MTPTVLANGVHAYNWDMVVPRFRVVHQKTMIALSQFEHEGMTYTFKSPYIIDAEYSEDGIYEYSNQRLGIYVQGKNYDELVESFAFSFYYQWKDIAMEDDKNLTQDAQLLKQILLAMCEVTK